VTGVAGLQRHGTPIGSCGKWRRGMGVSRVPIGPATIRWPQDPAPRAAMAPLSVKKRNSPSRWGPSQPGRALSAHLARRRMVLPMEYVEGCEFFQYVRPMRTTPTRRVAVFDVTAGHIHSGTQGLEPLPRATRQPGRCRRRALPGAEPVAAGTAPIASGPRTAPSCGGVVLACGGKLDRRYPRPTCCHAGRAGSVPPRFWPGPRAGRTTIALGPRRSVQSAEYGREPGGVPEVRKARSCNETEGDDETKNRREDEQRRNRRKGSRPELWNPQTGEEQRKEQSPRGPPKDVKRTAPPPAPAVNDA